MAALSNINSITSHLSCCDRRVHGHLYMYVFIGFPFPHPHHPMSLVTGESVSAECPPLKCPVHGLVDIANKFATVTEVVYTCEEGFVLHGDHKRYCQRNGQWTGRDPHCSVATGEAENVE